MFPDYILYPQAQQKLQQGGLVRIVKEKEAPDFPLRHLLDEEVLVFCNGLEKEGYLNLFSPAFKIEYNQKIKTLLNNRNYWRVQTPTGEEQKRMENRDILILGGYIASLVLTKKEFYNQDFFGFSSWYGFAGTLGAYLMLQNESTIRQGHSWESAHNGRKYKTEITGSLDADFRLLRTNITSYPTADPLGEVSLFRPTLPSDKTGLFSGHSVEQSLLVALIKYIEQEKIDSVIVHPVRYRDFLEEVRTWKPASAVTAENLYGVRRAFIPYSFAMPRSVEKRKRTPFHLLSQAEYGYELCIGEQGQLLFIEPREKREDIAVELYPEEIDQVVRGLFVQASQALGRTDVQVLIDTLAYRFSAQFKFEVNSLRG